jgi:N-dimethylarginine dimethylaminohydrolase
MSNTTTSPEVPFPEVQGHHEYGTLKGGSSPGFDRDAGSHEDRGMTQNTHPIGVYNEWGRLKEVLVGNRAHDIFPRWSPDWGRYQHAEQTKGMEGRRVADVAGAHTQAAVEQTDRLAHTLEQHGVTVHRPRLLTDEETAAGPVGLVGQYPRDPVLVLGKHVIETNLRMVFRDKEHLGYEELFRQRLQQDPDARHIRMPTTTPVLSGTTPEDFLNDPRPFLEGGDTFLMNKDILVGCSSLASSRAGVAWLQRYLGAEGYRVHLVPLTTEWLHLDCIFAIIREGLCMCYRDGFQTSRLPTLLKDWEVIEATAAEAQALGCNTLCLAPNVVVIGAEHHRLIKAIEQHGGEVIPVPFDQVSASGGGIRCSTHPLAREV